MRIPELSLAIGDPPFPGYVSGHATVSQTVAVVLSGLFPDKQKVWTDLARDARWSRLDAGIHFDVDNDAGYHYGGQLGEEILSNLRIKPIRDHSEPYQPVGRVSGTFQLASFTVANYVHSLRLSTIGTSVQRFFKNLVARGPNSDAATITFTDVALTAGIDYLQATTTDQTQCLAPSAFKPIGNCELNHMAGGVTVGDFNADNWPDLYVTRIGAPGILYANNRDGTFKDVTRESMAGPISMSPPSARLVTSCL
jgi:hypothetical protein